MKPGWKTTEFWVALLQVIIGAVLSYLSDGQNIAGLAALGGGALTGSVYAHGRSKIKAANGKE